jgi:hypothetical protein
MKLNLIRAILLNLFLLNFSLPLFFPLIYKDITLLNFSIVSPLAAIYFLNKKYNYSFYLTALILYLIVLILFGMPGSILGYTVSAIIGLYLPIFIREIQLNFRGVLIYPFFLTAIVYIISGVYILTRSISTSDHAEYFVIASVNYIGLTFAAFGIIYILIFNQISNFELKNNILIKISRFISLVILLILMSIALIFTTRSVLIACIPIFLFGIKINKIKTILIFLSIIPFAYYYWYEIMEFINRLIVPGRDSIIDLYESELAVDNERVVAIINAMKIALPKLPLCLECSEAMSYSSLANLLIFTFPFSLGFIFVILKSFVTFIGLLRINNSTLWILMSSLVSTSIMVLFQADFLSITAFFCTLSSINVYYSNVRRRINSSL